MGFVLNDSGSASGSVVTAAHELADLKVVYLALHDGLKRHPELMESDFLSELQTFLHQCATAAGIDGTDHAAWEAWLRG